MLRHANPCLALALVLTLGACAPGEEAAEAPATEPAAETAVEPAEPAPTAPAIHVEATDYAFTAPPTFPSGWVTLHFENAGEQTHFLLLWKLPEGKTFDDYASQLARPFSDWYKRYRAGELTRDEFLEQLGAALPEWFSQVERYGGPGFTAPGHTSQTTVHLDPGDYVMECYVRAAEEDDEFHGALGMLRPLIVTAEDSGGTPPEADIHVVLSNYEIAVHGEPTTGEQTVHVEIQENPEGLVLHNLHVARLAEGVTVEEAAGWLDWVDAMLPPSRAEFLGGAGQALAGSQSYFTVELTPGRYAWVSEAWGIQGMVREFTVD